MVSNTSVPYEYNDGCPIRGGTCLPFTSTCIHLFSFLCVLFLFCLSPCCVLCTLCCPFMIVAGLVFCVFCFYFVCLRVVSCVLNVVNVSCCPFMIVAGLVFCVFCFYFVCLRVVSCVLNVVNVSGCPFTIVADLVFLNVYLNSDSEQQ